MDIIDIILARALSPQGSIETIVRRAGEATTAAEAAVAAAEDALEEATQAITDAQVASAAGSGAAKALAPYNAFNLVALLPKTNASHAGVTYTWNDNGECTATTGNGQTTGQSVNIIYNNTSGFPTGVTVGQTYRVYYTGTNVRLQVRARISGAWSEIFGDIKNGTFTIPNEATGLLVRLTVISTGITVNETVKPIIVYGISNDELNNRIDNETFLAHGGLADNTDLDTIVAPGYYLLAGSRTYLNSPFANSNHYLAHLEVLKGSSNFIVQRITSTRDDQSIWYRCSVDGSFTYTDNGTTKHYVWNELKPYKIVKDYIDGIKTELEAEIAAGGGGGGHLDPNYAGRIVVIDNNGNITWSQVAEQELIDALIKSGDYVVKDAIGITIDYENKTYTQLTGETAINDMAMYSGRMRCNVDDSGNITAFYGDNNYAEDGSNGQVMVYQPKFYYKRTILESENVTVNAKIINKETILVSPIAQAGYKLHPLFINEAGEEVDYVLLSAYEASAYKTATSAYDLTDSSDVNLLNDKLSSIAGAKPISGVNKNFDVVAAERMAKNRGIGWHITNMQYESAHQMLIMSELGTPNCQTGIELGICQASNSMIHNCSFITGSTSSLGSQTGHAASSTQEINGTSTSYTEPGKRAISYRGVENPWGNIWHFIGGTNVYGNGAMSGGGLYFSRSFNYDPTSTLNYDFIGFNLPNTVNWISRFGYGNSNYDWAFVPIACDSSANSLLPVGDSIGVTANLNNYNVACCGGPWHFEERDGMFYYSCDQNITMAARSFGARIMFIPTKNTVYTNNIAKWTAKRGA